MRSKIFSMALGALACLILALPAAAQGGRSAAAGIFQGIYEALMVWTGGTDADLEAVDSYGDNLEIGAISFPGGIKAPGQPTDADSAHGLNGEPTPNAPEIGPIIIPAG